MTQTIQKITARTVAIALMAAVALVWAATPMFANAQQQSCGLDIALVLDSSGSISSSELTTMQDAFDGFVDAILVGDTQMTVIDFDASATVEQDWTSSPTAVKDGIDNGTSDGNTNWEDAINTAQGQFPHRTTNNPDVMIFVSDGNPNEPGSDSNALTVAQAAATTAKNAGTFIKAIGIGDDIDGPNLESISTDGTYLDSDFDQLETDLQGLAQTLCDEVVEEEDEDGNNNDTSVHNNNNGTVMNVTHAGAYTGGNTAGGSTGGDGARGGNVHNSGDDANENTTGNGGNGGDGGQGGSVVSGDAVATALTVNSVNSNVTRINRCGDCEGQGGNGNDVTVRNNNEGMVGNLTGARAKTGWNTAFGSAGGDGGHGGDVGNGNNRQQEENSSDTNENTTGNGGHGGDGSRGGSVRSGLADSYADTLNTVNNNTTRIRR